MKKNKYLSYLSVLFFIVACTSSSKFVAKKKPYNYGFVPKNYKEVISNYENYGSFLGCLSGETIASIGAGNGQQEVQVSCFLDGINWYLEEIDTARIAEFNKVLNYHEMLRDEKIEAQFEIVIGTSDQTFLPEGIFDRVLLVNVFHEISEPSPIMTEITGLLKPGGQLVIMERMGKKPGLHHGDCKHPKLFEPDFIMDMDLMGFELVKKQTAEEMSQLTFYTFMVAAQ